VLYGKNNLWFFPGKMGLGSRLVFPSFENCNVKRQSAVRSRESKTVKGQETVMSEKAVGSQRSAVEKQ